jgi:SAM-dependent methyltransferase
LVKAQAIEMAAGSSQPQLYRRALEVLKAHGIGPVRSVLDVGCGHGAFLGVLAARGFQVLAGCDGIDSPRDLPPGIAYQRVDLDTALPHGDETFDVVTSIEVIEHLENPRHHVRQLHRVCARGGVVLITTPNVTSIISRLSYELRGYFHYFGPRDYPAHITPVLPIDLERIFDEAGFTSREIMYSDWGRIPRVPWHWQDTALGRAICRGSLFSDQIVAIATR